MSKALFLLVTIHSVRRGSLRRKRSGLWLAAGPFIVGTGSEWFCHDAKGHWTKTAVPKRAGQQPGIDELAWIPGTRSLWATGGFNADAGEAIFKYGS